MAQLFQLNFGKDQAPALPLRPEQEEPAVLNAAFKFRMAKITAAEREVRAMGYSVSWSALAGPRPRIHLVKTDTSMAPILDRMSEKVIRDCEEGGYKKISGQFMDCDVSWIEPIPTCAHAGT
jgi:hypothetical protein